MTDRDAYVEKLKARLDEWNAEMSRLEAKAREARADAKIDYQRALADMAQQRERLREQLDDMRSSGEAAWQELRRGAESAMDEMTRAWEKARRHFD